MRLQREKWSFRNLEEVHQAANTVLRFAMFNERSKRWPKVTLTYSISLLLPSALLFSSRGPLSSSVYLPCLCLSACLSLSVCLPVSVLLCLCLSVFPVSVCLPVFCPRLRLSIFPVSACLPVSVLSLSLSACLSLLCSCLCRPACLCSVPVSACLPVSVLFLSLSACLSLFCPWGIFAEKSYLPFCRGPSGITRYRDPVS